MRDRYKNPQKPVTTIDLTFLVKSKCICTMKYIMSIENLLRTTICILFYSVIAAQEPEEVILYLDLNNNLLQSIKVNDDSTSATFSIYINGSEHKENRDSSIKLYEQNSKTSDQQMPTFSIAFYSIWSPEKIKDLKGIKFISLDQFKNSTLTNNIDSIIYKGDDGIYLKWKVVCLADE